jgi:hypothetical protein
MQSFSIIIPTLDEAGTLEGVLRSIPAPYWIACS